MTERIDLPVLILQNMRSDGPGYLATWLKSKGIACEVRDGASGQAFPARIDDWRALAVLGGAMSANDDLPYLRQAEALILQAFEADRPVVGHCLGGQLMAKALGARIGPSPRPEIGWQPMAVADDPLARDWFDGAASHTVMHWHYESFELPPGARLLASSAACPHQAFAWGRHLAMQFHIEIDEPKLMVWLAEGDPQWAAAARDHASVQTRDAILAEAPRRMASHQLLADHIYGRWLGVGSAA
jgi:GMP synthase-like glutamine amidotransferase